MFSVHVTLEKFENITIADRLVLDLCLRKTGAEKFHGYRDVIIFEKLRFQNVFLSHTKAKSRRFQSSTDLKSVFVKLRFQNVFLSHTKKKRRRFQSSFDLKSVFVKLRFGD